MSIVCVGYMQHALDCYHLGEFTPKIGMTHFEHACKASTWIKIGAINFLVIYIDNISLTWRGSARAWLHSCMVGLWKTHTSHRGNQENTKHCHEEIRKEKIIRLNMSPDDDKGLNDTLGTVCPLYVTQSHDGRCVGAFGHPLPACKWVRYRDHAAPTYYLALWHH